VKYYSPRCGHCKVLKPEYIKAAESLRGKIKVGAIDCDGSSEQAFCQSLVIKGFPTLKIHPVDLQTGTRRPETSYDGARESSAIINNMLQYTPKFALVNLSEANVASFLENVSLPRIVFFTDKAKAAPLLDGLAAEFDGRVRMGVVLKGKEPALCKKYSIDKFPSSLLFEGDSAGEAVGPFSANPYEELSAFLKELCKPKALPLAHLKSQEDFERHCLNAGNVVCVVSFLMPGEGFSESEKEHKENLDILEQVSKKYPAIRFMWTDPFPNRG
jgi:protein disulfide-isomerase A6